MSLETFLITYIPVISTVVVTVATVVLAWLTFKYVRLTKHMVDDMKRSREPAINVDFELPDNRLRLTISNTGLSPAKNIRFAVKKDFAWIRHYGKPTGIADIPPIKNGVSYLVPGRTLKYLAGTVKWQDIKDHDKLLSLQITFQNEQGNRFEQIIDIDMSQFERVLFESFKDPNIAVAEAIRETDDRRRFQERANNMFNHFKKTCPTCGESIKRDAKKCPHCAEWIEKKDVGDIKDEVVAE